MKTISTEEFDQKFEAGEDISEYLDFSKAVKRVNVDFPLWMVDALDREAERLQVPRQAIIKILLDERLKQTSNKKVPQEKPKKDQPQAEI